MVGPCMLQLSLPRAQAQPAGPGPARDRPCIYPPTKPAWSQVILLHATVAAAATDRRASHILHQPFRVDHIALQSDAAVADLITINLAVDNQESGTGDQADRGRMGLWRGSVEGLAGNDLLPFAPGSTLPVGTIIRSVPTRLIMTVLNSTAGTLDVAALITITYLVPAASAPGHS